MPDPARLTDEEAHRYANLWRHELEARLAAAETERDELLASEAESDQQTEAWHEAAQEARARLSAAENVVDALERLVAELETNTERGAPDYAHDALAAYDKQNRKP